MHIFALYSLKGGVGKTTTAVNLAWEAANAGLHVLVWDLDPQGAASWYLQAQPPGKLKAKKIISGKTPLGKVARATTHDRLDVIPGDFSFRHIDQLLGKAKKPKQILKNLVEPFGESYHLVILDCPPSISTLAASVLAAASTVLVPTLPTPLSLRALAQSQAFAKDEDIASENIRPFYSMVDRRKRLHCQMLNTPPKIMKKQLQSWISYSADIERMGETRMPAGQFAPRSPGALQFRALWQELEQQYELR